MFRIHKAFPKIKQIKPKYEGVVVGTGWGVYSMC